MVKVSGNQIVMTRGDTLKVKLNLTNSDGSAYTPNAQDVIKFGVKEDYETSTFKIEKTIPVQTLLLHITPSDTKTLDYGTYVWDCQITFAETNDVNTFITKGKLKITEEVV